MRKKDSKAVCNVDYANELKHIIDEVQNLVIELRSRGFVPTFSVKTGTIGMVAVYKESKTADVVKNVRTRTTALENNETGIGIFK